MLEIEAEPQLESPPSLPSSEALADSAGLAEAEYVGWYQSVVVDFHPESWVVVADTELEDGASQASLTDGEGALSTEACVGAAYQSWVDERALPWCEVEASPPAHRFPPMMAATEDEAGTSVSVAEGLTDSLAENVAAGLTDRTSVGVADGLAVALRVNYYCSLRPRVIGRAGDDNNSPSNVRGSGRGHSVCGCRGRLRRRDGRGRKRLSDRNVRSHNRLSIP